MPGRDTTGPRRGGLGLGRGRGIGIGGNCICPSCNTIVPHQIRVPCNTTKCPKCDTVMIRQ